MPKKKKKAVVPRLRFPEFRDAEPWEVKRLGEVCDVLQGYGFPERLQGKQHGKYPFCKVSDITNAVNNTGGYINKAANYVDDEEVEELRATPIPRGATIFAKIGEALRLNRRAFVETECLIDNNVVGIKGRDTQALDHFVFYLSQKIDLNKHCGGAVPSVNKSTLQSVKIVIPNLPEQQKIADCLSSLDELIRAEEAALESLTCHKKGLMQRLFPREGETTPALRFPEFRDAGPWEVKELQAALDYEQPGPFIVSSEHYGDSGTPVLTAGKTFILGYTLEDFGIYDRVPVIIFDDFTTESKYVDFPFKVKSSAMKILSEKPGYSLKFVHEAMSLIQFDASQHKRYWIGEFQHLRMPFPSYEEQQEIADCLSSLDELIRAKSERIEALKAHKRGLMQQLFPQEVG